MGDKYKLNIGDAEVLDPWTLDIGQAEIQDPWQVDMGQAELGPWEDAAVDMPLDPWEAQFGLADLPDDDWTYLPREYVTDPLQTVTVGPGEIVDPWSVR